jgi:hypothetical protein
MKKIKEKWSPDEHEVVLAVWNAGGRDAGSLMSLAEGIGRTPLALLVRLFNSGVVSAEEAEIILEGTGYPVPFKAIIDRQNTEKAAALEKSAARNALLLRPMVDLIRQMDHLCRCHGIDPKENKALTSAIAVVSSLGAYP